MRAVIVYESMYGNTHAVADHIGTGLAGVADVVVTAVGGAHAELIDSADLVVVGGPTHVHGMTSSTSRAAAVEAAEKDDDLALDPDAEGAGLRDWIDALPKQAGRRVAAFDTRVDVPAAISGRASKGIARRLRKHGCDLVTDPESFLVDKENHLLEGEVERAEAWGARLAAALEGSAGR
jgi:flavorubredoxin